MDRIKESIYQKMRAAIKKDPYVIKEDDSLYCKIFVDREETIPDEALKKILESDSPAESFTEWLNEEAVAYGVINGLEIIKEMISNTISLNAEEKSWKEEKGEDIYEEMMFDILNDSVTFYYDANDFNTEKKVNLMLDTGDGKSDFAMNNALNGYGNYSMELEDGSSILWLAGQQGKKDLLLSEMKRIYTKEEKGEYVDREKSGDVFIESVLQELENSFHCCTCLTFLLSMSVLDLIDFKDRLNNKTIDKFTVSKNSECGLFAPFVGGGSCLEIVLDKDVEIPAEYVWTIHPDGIPPYLVPYDVDNVYGLVSDAWRGTLTYERR